MSMSSISADRKPLNFTDSRGFVKKTPSSPGCPTVNRRGNVRVQPVDRRRQRGAGVREPADARLLVAEPRQLALGEAHRVRDDRLLGLGRGHLARAPRRPPAGSRSTAAGAAPARSPRASSARTSSTRPAADHRASARLDRPAQRLAPAAAGRARACGSPRNGRAPCACWVLIGRPVAANTSSARTTRTRSRGAMRAAAAGSTRAQQPVQPRVAEARARSPRAARAGPSSRDGPSNSPCEQRAQVEAGAAGHDRQAAAAGDVRAARRARAARTPRRRRARRDRRRRAGGAAPRGAPPAWAWRCRRRDRGRPAGCRRRRSRRRARARGAARGRSCRRPSARRRLRGERQQSPQAGAGHGRRAAARARAPAARVGALTAAAAARARSRSRGRRRACA